MTHYTIHSVDGSRAEVSFHGVPYADFDRTGILIHLTKLKVKEKGRDLTQSYDKSPYTHRKIQKAT